MSTLLIVSPYFPPVNAPDMQRVRMSLPYFAEFGWKPVVLAVDPQYAEREQDPLLLETLPPDVPVYRVRAMPVRWTRKIGIGAIGLRAFPYLYRAGSRLIQEHGVDLVYFSTTAFPVMALGRIWKRRFGVPFVIDLQDPWVSDYYERKPKAERPPKYRLAQWMHKRLESFTMRAVDGIIAVSQAYHETLQRRYPWIDPEVCRTIPFGAAPLDLEVAARAFVPNRFFDVNDGNVHGVYIGRGGQDMALALRGFFRAFKFGLERAPEIFDKVRLYFIGTDYASPERARKTVEPVARQEGVARYVHEETQRIPYFEVLRFLLDAQFLVVPGSDDPQYTASKIYPYILARKPLLAVFHERSSVVEVLQKTNAGVVVPFSDGISVDDLAEQILHEWTALLERLPFTPETNWRAFEPYTARELTRRQCELFDFVLERHRRGKQDVA